jgi:hypothetical protein
MSQREKLFVICLFKESLFDQVRNNAVVYIFHLFFREARLSQPKKHYILTCLISKDETRLLGLPCSPNFSLCRMLFLNLFFSPEFDIFSFLTGKELVVMNAVKTGKKFFGLDRNIFSLGWVSFFTDVSSEMIYPLLPVFLTAVLGVGTTFVGLVEGAAEATASLLKLFSGWLSDRLGKRKFFFRTPFGGCGHGGMARFIHPFFGPGRKRNPYFPPGCLDCRFHP